MPLGEVVRFKSGESRPQDLIEAPKGDRVVPVYGGNGVMGYTSQSMFPDTRLIVGRVGAYCGCVHLAPRGSWITDNALYSSQLLREVSLEFLAAQLQFKDLNRLKRKAAQPLVTQSILNKLLIVLPPLREQRAIVHVLQTVQRAKEARQRELALERERKAALMEYLFTQGTRGEKATQTEIGQVPESWKVVRIADVCSVKTSFPSFGDVGILDTRNAMDVLVLGLKVSDMNLPGNETSIYSSQNQFRIPTSKLPPHCVHPNSIVFPKRGAAIATNKKRLTTTYCVLDPNLIGVEPFASLDSHFLAAFFMRFDLRLLQDNTPIPQLNKHNVEGVLIPLPPIDEQHVIGELSMAEDTKIAALAEEGDELQELFGALLENLMNGRVDLHNLIGEGASN